MPFSTSTTYTVQTFSRILWSDLLYWLPRQFRRQGWYQAILLLFCYFDCDREPLERGPDRKNLCYWKAVESQCFSNDSWRDSGGQPNHDAHVGPLPLELVSFSSYFTRVPHYHVVSKKVNVGMISPVVNYFRAFLIEGLYRRLGRSWSLVDFNVCW